MCGDAGRLQSEILTDTINERFFIGATGFVGSVFVRCFIADNSTILASVRIGSVGLADGVENFELDLTALVDSGSTPLRVELAGLVANDSRNDMGCDDAAYLLARTINGCDAVVHVAARAHVMPNELGEPLAEYRWVNRKATLALARLAA